MFASFSTPPAPATDDTFVAQLRSGDDGAFETLYQRTHAAAYSTALRIVGNSVDAQDVTQAAYMKVWYLREGLNFSSPEGWMVRVARNIAIDLVRRRATRARVALGDSVDDVIELEDVALAALDVERLHAALPQLPPNERRVIELRYLRSATEAEVSVATGTALGTIKTRTRSGLRRLRRLLAETA